MAEKVKYTKTITTRVPEAVWKAIMKKARDKQREFGKYGEADVIRSAVVNDLKNKGYLDKKRSYL